MGIQVTHLCSCEHSLGQNESASQMHGIILDPLESSCLVFGYICRGCRDKDYVPSPERNLTRVQMAVDTSTFRNIWTPGCPWPCMPAPHESSTRGSCLMGDLLKIVTDISSPCKVSPGKLQRQICLSAFQVTLFGVSETNPQHSTLCTYHHFTF